MLQIRDWSNVILHLDGDAFFASIIQAINPCLKGKPVVVGGERGIATAVSYEAKKMGIKRGMRIFEIKKIVPNCFIAESDFELYGLFSKKMFDIVRSFSPTVEEYSIDECFADLKGMRRPLNMSYEEIGRTIKTKVEKSLGITVSVGISLTKSLAKLASSYQKPSGFTMIKGPIIEKFLEKIKVREIWGIGENTESYLNKMKIFTALDFVEKDEDFVRSYLTKPFLEIWKELRGEMVYELNPYGKESTKSVTRSQTFSPPTKNKDLLYSRLMAHVEDAFTRARKLNYQVGKLAIFLKTQQFRYLIHELKIIPQISYPMMIRDKIESAFEQIYNNQLIYRTTGCTIFDLSEISTTQPGLFSDKSREEKIKKIYPLFEQKKVNFGLSLFDKERLKPVEKEKRLQIPLIQI